jgi:3-deoxy-7-phosphoheptulonate synthase
MILVMKANVTEEQIQNAVSFLESHHVRVHLSRGEERTIIGMIGDKKILKELPVETLPGVERAVHVTHPFKLASRDFHPDNTRIRIGNVEIGGDRLVVIAGPCSVESREQLFTAAEIAKAGGAQLLRGGAFKPRTSPYSFQGLKEEGLKILAEARERTGLPVVTELMDIEHLPLFEEYVDVIQLGARNMQNFPLLKAVGRTQKPVLLKRGLSATIEEWLMSAEYIMAEGNPNVILCERGIRTFETATRNTLDINAVPVVKHLSHLPIVVDPSHATGVRAYVPAAAKAGLAAGADGLIMEMHPEPSKALSDGAQSLNPAEYQALMQELKQLARALGREIGTGEEHAVFA